MPRCKEGFWLLVVWGLLHCSCGNEQTQPVPIVFDEDSCSQCRMAVSEPEFASEAVMPTGTVRYFDDFGCLVRWLASTEVPPGTGLFVLDYESGKWLTAPEAHYVQSDRLPTPMSSGLAAFETESQARAAAKTLEGSVLNWNQVTESRVP